MGVYENRGPPNIDPKIVRFSYNEDPNQVPLISETPIHLDLRHASVKPHVSSSADAPTFRLRLCRKGLGFRD